ncbi:MAG TPA: phosphotriesterase [Prolixibacteraceae bacterium]|jgi:phosphotriesterase-related protein
MILFIFSDILKASAMRPSQIKNVNTYFLLMSLFFATSCQNNDLKIITVTGEIPASQMGITLTHEHVLVDFAMIDSIGPNRYNKDSVITKVLPYFEELKPFNVKTFVDCTPEFMGKDPQLLAELSRKSGIHILTNTGWYAADSQRHIPHEISNMSAEEIAEIWIGEAKNGIGNTGIKPGFIKIGINDFDFSETDKKLVAAACLTHLETGLTIVSHTGRASAALAQLQILKKYGVDPSAFIWAHAMVESSKENILAVSQMGCWVAFDGVREEIVTTVRFTDLLHYMKSTRQLNRVLLSHDAGWYQPGKPNGGEIRPYTSLFNSLIPYAMSEGITQAEIDQIIIKNPAEAFAVRVRKSKKD